MSNLQLSDRLKRVASFVRSGGVVADIGCDHGFTSIYLVENNLASSAIAMDINSGPLERAKAHIREYGFEDKITTRLSDGAEKLAKGEADTILISGMGGALMRRILNDSIDVVSASKELVLSPQSEIFLVRHFLHENGFRITDEQMLFEAPKYYVIIRAERGNEKYLSEAEYIYGKLLIDRKDEMFCAYLESERVRISDILGKMGEGMLSDSAKVRRESLAAELEQIVKLQQNGGSV